MQPPHPPLSLFTLVTVALCAKTKTWRPLTCSQPERTMAALNISDGTNELREALLAE